MIEYLLQNDILCMTVNRRGAEMTSLVEKATGRPLLWKGQPGIWPRSAPLLFPYTGRLKNGRYSHGGQQWAGGQHGFACDMPHRLFAASPHSLAFLLDSSPQTLALYPFPFSLATRHTLLENRVYHTVAVTNCGQEEMAFGLGFHPGFICPFDATHTTGDYQLVFETAQHPIVVETSESTGLVTGRRIPLPLVEGRRLPLHDDLFVHDSICLTGLTAGWLTLEEVGTGRGIRVHIAGFPYVLVWSAKTPRLQFICIEPWYSLPDSVDATGEWNDKPAAARLMPGQTFTAQLEIECLGLAR